MKIKDLTITEVWKLVATGEGFDPVTIYLEDSKGSNHYGKLIIESGGDAWSNIWGAMGEGYTIRKFLLKANNDYNTRKLCRGGNIWTTDYAKIKAEAGCDIEGETLDSLGDSGDYEKLVKQYGEDWVHDLPSCYTREYQRVIRLVEVVRQAIVMEGI